MTEKAKEWTPKAKARLAGVFEAPEGFTSAFGRVNKRWKAQAEGMERSHSGQVDRAGVEPAKRVAMRLPVLF